MESFIGISIGLSQQAIRVSLTVSWSSPHNYLINCQTHANFKSQICDWELLTVFSQQLPQETWGAVFCFFFGKSKSGFPNPKADLAFSLDKSKNGSGIHKIHTQGGFFELNPNPDFWDSQSERIFGKGFEKSIFDKRFFEKKKKKGMQQMPYMYD